MNQLQLLEEFKEALADYHVSEAGKNILDSVKLVLLAAPTSSGRNTIIRELLKTGNYHYIVSDTTRSPRTNDDIPEKNGVEYWFRDEKDVLSDLRNGKYLEAAIIHNQQVSGISIKELERAEAEQKIAITDIEIVGVETILRAKPDTLAVFVFPPDFAEWQKRIKARGHMNPEEFKRRLESAAKEFKTALESSYYKFVINDDLREAIKALDELAQSGDADEKEQQECRKLLEELYTQTLKAIGA